MFVPKGSRLAPVVDLIVGVAHDADMVVHLRPPIKYRVEVRSIWEPGVASGAGRALSYQDVVSFNRRVWGLSGVERFRSRLCRHTFATEWRNAGGSLAALQATLGHSNVKVTEIYGTVSDDLVEREARRITEVRKNGTKNGTGS
jgi:integrase